MRTLKLEFRNGPATNFSNRPVFGGGVIVISGWFDSDIDIAYVFETPNSFIYAVGTQVYLGTPAAEPLAIF